jgi:hypothetical protein
MEIEYITPKALFMAIRAIDKYLGGIEKNDPY